MTGEILTSLMLDVTKQCLDQTNKQQWLNSKAISLNKNRNRNKCKMSCTQFQNLQNKGPLLNDLDKARKNNRAVRVYLSPKQLIDTPTPSTLVWMLSTPLKCYALSLVTKAFQIVAIN